MNGQPISEHTRALAVHGSYCPKLCNHTCPVLAATGRDEAMPWSLHRVVADVATGRTEPDASAAAALQHCTGCGACATACAWDEQDVPAQVRAGRAATFPANAEAQQAAATLQPGAARAHGALDDDVSQPSDATTTLVVGCNDRPGTVRAFLRLCALAETPVRVTVPDGCCGALLTDVGAADDAAAATDRLAERLSGDVATIVALDPHCLPALRTAYNGDVTDAVTFVAGLYTGGRLPAPHVDDITLAWHDPCVLARIEGVIEAPRHLLSGLGFTVIEVEEHGTRSRCSGGGMAFPLLEPDGAAAVAAARARQLEGVDAPVLTACAGARIQLADAGAPVHDLFEYLADHFEGTR